MILKELILISFGKFANRKVNLKEGLNIIYGENEAGKSTIHKFIEAMFFGFFKPYTKRKIYTEEYDKYFPWNGNSFRGILKYEHDNVIYRIERNLEKGYDEVKIFDDKTGEEITHFFEYDKVLRLYDPSSLHLGLNTVIYNNTISVRQLANKTEVDLVKEVKDSLINLGGSMDEDISVKKVIESLGKQIDEIGNSRRMKSPYGKISEDLEKLEREREKAQKNLYEIKEQQARLNTIIDEIQKLNRQKVLIESYRAKIRYEKAIELINEIESINRQVTELKEYSEINTEEFEDAIKLASTMDSLNETIQKLKDKQSKINIELADTSSSIEKYYYFKNVNKNEEIDEIVGNYKISEDKKQELSTIEEKIRTLSKEMEQLDNISLSDLNEDYFIYEEKEIEKNNLLSNNVLENMAFLKSRIEEKTKEIKRLNILRIVSVFAALFIGVSGLMINPLLYFLLTIPVGLLIYIFIVLRDLKAYLVKTEKQLKEVENREKEKTIKVNRLEEETEKILKKYGCSNKSDFRRFVSQYSNQAALLKNNQIALKELIDRKNKIGEEIKNIEEVIKKYLELIGTEEDLSFQGVKKIKQFYNDYLELSRLQERLNNENNEIIKEIRLLEEKRNSIKNEMEIIFNNNRVKDIESFKLAVDRKRQLIEIIKIIENKTVLLNSILGDDSLDIIKAQAERFNSDSEEEIKELNKVDLQYKLEEIQDNIRQKREEAARIEENIRNISSMTRPLVDIDEEIARKTRIKEEYDKKIIALNLAKNTIEEISKKIQRDFAPKLNKKVGQIIDGITEGKYVEVKISENLDIKIVEPTTSSLVDIEKLSGGTIDQLYFATRYGIIDIIREENNLPLILDDCFVQYDMNRLYNILNFLAKESYNRQIILFTCHRREKELLDNMKVRYNYIEL